MTSTVEITENTAVVTVDTTVTLPGNYFKSTTRVGLAFTTVNEDGTLAYTNRRGESVTIDFKTFEAKWAEGYTALNARTLNAEGVLVTPAQVEAAADHASVEAIESALDFTPVGALSGTPISAEDIEALLAEMDAENSNA